jgi:hypothetical protein
VPCPGAATLLLRDCDARKGMVMPRKATATRRSASHGDASLFVKPFRAKERLNSDVDGLGQSVDRRSSCVDGDDRHEAKP